MRLIVWILLALSAIIDRDDDQDVGDGVRARGE